MTTTAAPYPAPPVVATINRTLAAANDRPRPIFDATCSPQKYARMSQNFRASAWQHLDENDLSQAANKAWGMVAETVKAICAHHGRIIHNIRSIWMVGTALARLVGDSGDMATRHWINNSFMVARCLYFNFYGEIVHEDEVRDGLMRCEELSQLLYALFWPEGAAV